MAGEISTKELAERLMGYLKRQAKEEDVYRLAAHSIINLARFHQFINKELNKEAEDFLLAAARGSMKEIKKIIEDPNYDEPLCMFIKR